MTIRITGMNSGLDTESIITELASARSVKVQKIEKEQTKLSWKIDAWKELNTKIYDFYSDVLSDMRFDYAYTKKKTTVSDTSVVSVQTSGDAMNGVQTLKVDQLAKTGYLTGAKIDASSGEKLLANFAGLEWLKDETKSVAFNVTVGGETKQIKLTGYNTLNDVVSKFNEIGVNAKFDSASGRLFITSKETGAAANFTLTPSTTDALYSSDTKALGLSGTFKEVPAERTVPAEWNDDLDQAVKDEWQAKYDALSVEDKAKWTDAKAMYDAERQAALDANADRLQIIADNNALIAEAEKLKIATGFKKVPTYKEVPEEQEEPKVMTQLKDLVRDDTDPANDQLNQWWNDQEVADQAKWQAEWDALTEKPEGITSAQEYAYQSAWKESFKAHTDWADAEAEREAIIASNESIPKIIAANNKLMASTDTSAQEFTATLKALGLLTADMAEKYGAEFTEDEIKAGKAATMIDGQDAVITLNGATFTSDKNVFEINGLTMTVHKETKDEITLTTEQDTDQIYDTIKNFFVKYNELIIEMDKLYNAESASSYEPLTKDEKEALSDTEVEEWEKKIKDSLLRRDSTLSSLSSAIKNVFLNACISDTNGRNNGNDKYLSYFGIETLGYFKAKDNEKYAYHIDGNADDSNVKNNEDKLKKAIANEPETVIEFFKNLSNNLYDTLTEKMDRSDYSSAFTVYNDKLYDTQLKEYTTKIKTEQDKLNDYIDRWYAKFSQMEVALSKLNSQESSISSLFG